MEKVFVYITDARDGFNVYVLDDQRMIKDLERTGLKTIEAVRAYINVLRQHYEVTSVEDITMTADDLKAVHQFCQQNKQRGQKYETVCKESRNRENRTPFRKERISGINSRAEG